MVVDLKVAEMDRLARAVADLTGETPAEAVRAALRERLERERRRLATDDAGLIERLEAIAAECADLPDLDTRPADAIIGYDDAGLPG